MDESAGEVGVRSVEDCVAAFDLSDLPDLLSDAPAKKAAAAAAPSAVHPDLSPLDCASASRVPL